MADFFASAGSYLFLQNALWAALLASVACGIVGTLVVCNRLTFLAGGASHAAYGGLGLAIFFGWPPLVCTLLFSLGASLLMGFVSLNTPARLAGKEGGADSAIGVLWAAGMAFGIILIELTPGYAGELMGFLFGSILTVPQADIWAMALFDALLVLVLVFFRQGLWAISIDKDFAQARGLPVRFLYLLLVGLTALAVVMLIRIVGLILVLALLTIPPAIARRFCHSLYTCMAVAGVCSLLFSLAGLVLAWYTNISSGAAIIAVSTLAYGLATLPFMQRKTE